MAGAGQGGGSAAPPPPTPGTLDTTALPAAADALAAARPAAPAPLSNPLTVLSALADATPPLLPGQGQADIERQRGYEHLVGLQRHYQHKSKWSYFLMGMMAGMLGFQSLLLALVGAGFWDFTGYAWLLPALLVQNLAQIAGLCVIVVQSLFKDIH